MNTEDFIGALSRQTPPPAPKRAMLAVYGLIGLALAGVVFIAIGGVRADLGAAWLSTTLKMSFGALAAIAFLPILNRVIGQNHRILDAAFGVGGVLVLAVLVSAIGLAATDTTLRSTRWTGGGVPDCLWQIPLIAAPTAAALMFAVRRFGPTRLGFAGLGIGAMAGAASAIPYSLFCPIDFAPYVATWYTAAFAICAVIGAILGARLLRW